jgi:hypothetical protein
MSAYFSRLVDRTLSRLELIRPRPAALFGQPIAEPDWQMHDPQLRSSAARAQENTSRDPNERLHERESAAPARTTTAAAREAQRGLAPRRAEPAREFGQAAAPAAAELTAGHALTSPVALPMIGTPPVITREGEAAPGVGETRNHRHAPVDPVQRTAPDLEDRDGSRGTRVQRDSWLPPAPITSAGDRQLADVRNAPAAVTRLIQQGPPQHGELDQVPQTHAAERNVTRKTLQGRRSDVPVEATAPPSSLADILGTRGMLTAAARSRSQSTSRGTESSTVHVTIGTLEVRANSPPAPSRAKPQTAKGPRLGLDEYLRQRRDGGRG